MEVDEEVLFESWVFKLKGANEKKTYRLPVTRWKKQYCLLWRKNDRAMLHLHEKKPTTLKDVAKLQVPLQPSFYIEKMCPIHNKNFVCELRTESKKLILAFDEEKLFHLFAFYVQCQAKLREEYWGECAVVRPDNSECQRKIGARGNMCVLHISRWGITLALELSKCVLAQWPLKCIKSYESTSRMQFAFDTGRRAPMGEGVYVFSTRANQDNILFDALDRYVTEAESLTQMITSAAANSPEEAPHSMSSQLVSLQSLTVVNADPQFVSQLRRISRDMYDQLSQHIGGTLSPMRQASSNDILGDSQPRAIHNRHGSQPLLDTPNTTNRFPPRRTDPFQKGTVPIGRDYENQEAEENSETLRKQLVGSVGSHYLHMGSRDNLALSVSPVRSLASPGVGSPNVFNDQNHAGASEKPPTLQKTGVKKQLSYKSQFSTESVRAKRYVNTDMESPSSNDIASSPRPSPSETYDTPVRNQQSHVSTKPPYSLARQTEIMVPPESVQTEQPSVKPKVRQKPTVAEKPVSQSKRPELIVNLPPPVGNEPPSVKSNLPSAVSNDYIETTETTVEKLEINNNPVKHSPIPQFSRLMSRSAENISDYACLGESPTETLPYYTYDNSSFRHSSNDESIGEYSYAAVSAAPVVPLQNNQVKKLRNRNVADLYARPASRAMRKSVSLTNLVEGPFATPAFVPSSQLTPNTQAVNGAVSFPYPSSSSQQSDQTDGTKRFHFKKKSSGNTTPLILPGQGIELHNLSRQDSSISQSSIASSNSPSKNSVLSPSPSKVTMPGVKFTASSKSFKKVRTDSPTTNGESPLLRQKSLPNPNEGRRLPSLPPGAALSAGISKNGTDEETLC